MESFKGYEDKGLTGLANLGNTCFLNSTIQCISHTYELNEVMNKDNSKFFKSKKESDTIICKEWNELRKIMWDQNCIVSPGRFVSTIHKIARLKNRDIFTGFAQNDLPEFFLFFIDEIHNSFKRNVKIDIEGDIKNEKDKLATKCYKMMETMYTKEYSEVVDLFYGVHVSQIKDMCGNVMGQNPEPFLMVNLPIPKIKNDKTVSIIDCFNMYTKEELMDGENKWYNEDKKEKQDAKKQILFFSLPQILVVDFKRFDNSSRKNSTFIDFPLDNLDLSEYIIGYDEKSYMYECYGICNHTGTSMGGHYTAFVKNANNDWYHFNDKQVVKIDKNDTEKIKSKYAYCLFFRKKINA